MMSNGFSIKGKFFENSIETDKIEKVINNYSVTINDFGEAGEYLSRIDGKYNDINASFILKDNYDVNKKTIIYVPDIFEFRCEKSEDKILKNINDYNIIVVHIPCSENINTFSNCSKDADKFQTVFAITVLLIEEIIKFIKSKSQKNIAVAGVGIGGWIINLHHALYNTSYIYIPCFSGSGLGDFLFNSPIKKNMCSEAIKNSQKLINIFNFDDIFMAQITHKNVFPLLSENDKIVNYNRQKTTYGDVQIESIKGNYSSCLKDYKKISNHIILKLKNTDKRFL